jgi:hypothetical protein
MFPMRILFFCLFSLFIGCTSADRNKKTRLKGEFIYRRSCESFFSPPTPQLKQKQSYPWENSYVGNFPRITKEFFRCKGSHLNPLITYQRESKEPLFLRDCQGADHHGLPLKGNQEFIYPCLIELLNYIQEKTGRRVILTSGHRCPQHNTYCDPTPKGYGSKHMLGAEVDFYLEGLEFNPEESIALLQNYYSETLPFKTKKEFCEFTRYDRPDRTVKTPPWYNKEIFIKLYQSDEERNPDNQHPFPYVSVQVRYDRENDSKVLFDAKATQRFLRH